MFQHPRSAHIDTRERSLQDEHARVVKDRGGIEHLLPHTVRVGRERLIPILIDPDELEEALDYSKVFDQSFRP